jgi:hypothetical protein
VTLVEESEALHESVRSFANRSSQKNFDDLALEIADFQARYAPGFRRLRDARPEKPKSASEIPAVPSDAFRLTRVAVHPAELDVARFVTSGTTDALTGVHPMRTLATYRELALLSGQSGLLDNRDERRIVVALAEDPGEPGTSSLGFMMRIFMQTFDDSTDPERWIVHGSVDLERLERALRQARDLGRPLLVLATSFALVSLLDAIGGATLECPSESIVMPTGGFKGRTREIGPEQLRTDVARAFGLGTENVIFEYGMTELTSQLYEIEPGLYAPPPWLSVSPVDPVSLEPVDAGASGLARFVDLGNVDSAVAIVTQDLIRAHERGIELIGRQKGAPPRGCSLALETLIGGAR